jgi:hypothetical protein
MQANLTRYTTRPSDGMGPGVCRQPGPFPRLAGHMGVGWPILQYSTTPAEDEHDREYDYACERAEPHLAAPSGAC